MRVRPQNAPAILLAATIGLAAGCESTPGPSSPKTGTVTIEVGYLNVDPAPALL